MNRLSEKRLAAIEDYYINGPGVARPSGERNDIIELVRGYREFREVLEAWRDEMEAQAREVPMENGGCVQCYGRDGSGEHYPDCLVARTIAVLAGGAE